jgi:hypothetical protein
MCNLDFGVRDLSFVMLYHASINNQGVWDLSYVMLHHASLYNQGVWDLSHVMMHHASINNDPGYILRCVALCQPAVMCLCQQSFLI